MPLCAYFVSGKCQYGNKCHNSHIDVQQMVQTEMSAAVDGKQWPLSSFSPFKDEPSLPDLIEDQSFEEIRWNCYLAKAENRLPQFQEDYKRLMASASEKMSKLKVPNAAVKNYLVEIYGINGKRSRQVKGGGTFGNTFSSADTNRSIFDRISNNATTEAPSFGGNTFSGGSIFGGGQPYGAQAQQKSIFGQQQSSFAQQPPAQSIFSQNQPTNNFFKMSQLGGPQSASGGNIFGQSSFGQTSTYPATTVSSSIFGGGSAGGFNTQPMTTESIFGGSNTFAQPNQAFAQAPSSFGQAVLAPATFAAPQSVFGQQQPIQHQQQQQSMQQQSMQQLQQQQSMQHHQQEASFGQMMHQPNMQTNIQQQQPIQQPVFAAAPPQSVFGIPDQQQQQQQPRTSVFANPSPFAQNAPQTPRMNPPVFAQQQQQQQPVVNLPLPAQLFSKIDDLTPEDIEAFKADSFQLGKIPTKPPPLELCGL